MRDLRCVAPDFFFMNGTALGGRSVGVYRRPDALVALRPAGRMFGPFRAMFGGVTSDIGNTLIRMELSMAGPERARKFRD